MNKYNEAVHALAHYSGFLFDPPTMSLDEAMVIVKELVGKVENLKITCDESWNITTTKTYQDAIEEICTIMDWSDDNLY